MLRVLDPENEAKSVHNRYGSAIFVPATSPEPRFELESTTAYLIRMPLETGLFDALGVGYIMEVDLPDAEGNIPGFKVIGRWDQYRLLAREKNSPSQFEL
jgi:hypothetical protein